MDNDEALRLEGMSDAAQIAFDSTSDDPQPGDWNAACEHIAELIRAEIARRKGPDVLG